MIVEELDVDIDPNKPSDEDERGPDNIETDNDGGKTPFTGLFLICLVIIGFISLRKRNREI